MSLPPASDYDGVSPTLLPLFEAPMEWFGNPPVQYETHFGPWASLVHLTPHVVEFHVRLQKDQFPAIDEWDHSELDSDTAIGVQDESAAYIDGGRPKYDRATVWTERHEDLLTVHELVPFNEQIETPAELEEQLEQIMSQKPDFETLFAESRSVVDDPSTDIEIQ